MKSIISILLIVLFFCLAGIFLILKPVKAQPNQRKNADAMRVLRTKLLTASPSEFKLKPTNDFPNVYGVIMDWPLDGQTVSVVALSDGNASLYTTSTFGVIGGFAHESVQLAAKNLVKMGEKFRNDAVATTNYSYPNANHIRYYLITFQGVKVIDTDLASTELGNNKYIGLFNSAQELILQFRRIEK